MAVAASLSVARHRQEEVKPEAQPASGRTPPALGVNLDAIRSAGL